MWKLPASRTFICGMGKRFYGISGSSNIGGAEEQQQQQQVAVNFMMQAIEEKMQKIVQMREKEKEYDQQQKDIAKMVSEQCQKQMARQNAKMEELEKSFLESQQRMALNFNEFQRTLKSIQDQQRAMAIKFGNPSGNGWKKNYWNGLGLFNNKCTISNGGLEVNTSSLILNIYAAKGFPISPKHFSIGTILYYYEVTQISSTEWPLCIGLSAGYISNYKFVGYTSNSYALPDDSLYSCKLSGKWHDFEWPKGAIKPAKWNGIGDVVGCGILFESMQKLSIFFTLNGILLGKKIPIKPSVNCLYPTVTMSNVCLEGNFGDNPAKPFKYDIKKCAGMVGE